MGIDKGKLFDEGPVFIDYPFEQVMYRWDFNMKKIFVKFYGKEESLQEISHDNRLYNDALRFGNLISFEEYVNGRSRD